MADRTGQPPPLTMSPSAIDFNSPEFLTDPYPFYSVLRNQAPILYRPDHQLWFLSRYEDVNDLLRDRRLGRSILHVVSREELGWPPIPEAHAPFERLNDHSMMNHEPPAHTRLKALVQKAFTPRTVENLRGRIQDIAGSLIDAAIPARRLDLLEGFAVPISVHVIAELLGVPLADRANLRPWSHDIVAMFEFGAKDDAVAVQAVRAAEEFSAYLRRLIDERRARPQDDLLSAMVAAEDGGERLSMDELIATSVLILNAGHEATVNVVGNGLYALIRHPDQLARLRADPTLTASAIEEMMRYDTPLPLFKRWVLEDMSYKGFEWKRGMEIAFLLGSANHDPARFADPHRFDISRTDNPHVSFGAGVHFCLGAPLARLELQVAIRALLDRLPDLRIVSQDIVFKGGFVFRGLKELVVAW